MSEPLLLELAKLEALIDTGKSKWPSVSDSLDGILSSLEEAKASLARGEHPSAATVQEIELRKRGIDERQKEIYNSLNRIGKSLDKKFANPTPVLQPTPFETHDCTAAMQQVVYAHLLRCGEFSTAAAFGEETGTSLDPVTRDHLHALHSILSQTGDNNLQPAIRWAEMHRDALTSRNSDLEFRLYKLDFIRIVLSDSSNSVRFHALQHLRSIPPHLNIHHGLEVRRMFTALLFLPHARLLESPYKDLIEPTLSTEVESEFVREYCASIGLARSMPLRTVCDLGAGDAIVRIEKGKKLMREKKSEWSQSNELPIEVPLTPSVRYHSIFACPVSKEQATEANPPMMLTCGHVLAKDSASNMSKGGGKLKCPYCPVDSSMGALLRLYF